MPPPQPPVCDRTQNRIGASDCPFAKRWGGPTIVDDSDGRDPLSFTIRAGLRRSRSGGGPRRPAPGEQPAARLGGDEVAVLLQQADVEAARAKASSLSEQIEADPFEAAGERVPLAGSFGVRAFADQETAEQWLAEADAQMFVRKRTGR